MTPRRSLIGQIAAHPWFVNNTRRRAIFGVAVAVCAVLTFFPQKYRAVVTLSPTDPKSLGLNGALSQLGSSNSAFGGQAALDLTVKVGKSIYVRQKVSKKLNLPQVLGMTDLQVIRWLDHHVTIRTLRGGLLEIEMLDARQDLGLKMVSAYLDTIRDQLASISRNQTTYKREVLEDLVKQADARLDKAQADYDAFRRESRFGDPKGAVAEISSRVPSLQREIRDKEREIATFRQFAGPENMQLRNSEAAMAALRQQLIQAQSDEMDHDGSLGQVISQSTQTQKLRHELDISRELYYSYNKYLQGTVVEDMTSDANIRVIEPAYIDPDRQKNFGPLVLGVMILLLGLAVEVYRLRPPVGDRVPA
jgi:uncharacterized protein involved in exopolysaccharide biosynthesis